MLEGLQCPAWRLCFLVMIKNEWRVCCRRSNIDAVNCVNWRPFLFQNYTYSNKKSWNVSCSTALFVSSSALFQLPAHLQNLKWRTRIPNGGWKRVLITLGAKEFFLFCSFSSAWLCIQRWLTNPSIFCKKKERNSHRYAEERRLNLFVLPWYWLPRWEQSTVKRGFSPAKFSIVGHVIIQWLLATHWTTMDTM